MCSYDIRRVFRFEKYCIRQINGVEDRGSQSYRRQASELSDRSRTFNIELSTFNIEVMRNEKRETATAVQAGRAAILWMRDGTMSFALVAGG